MSSAAEVAAYIGGLVIGQGRYAGEPFRLLGWQRRFLRVFNGPGDGALSLARGGGKSVFTAALASAAVDVDGPLVEPMGATVCIASSFDQAKEAIFDHLLWFLRPTLERYGTGPKDRFRLQDSANRAVLTDRETGASVRVLGCDPRRGHGLQPRLIIADESSQWEPSKRDRMLAALKTSRGKIPGSKMLWIGTRPAEPDHPFQRALDGHGTSFQMSYSAPEGANPFVKATWLRANPSLRYGFPDLEAVIRQEAQDARRDPDALASFRALRLNQGLPDTPRSVLVDAATWRSVEADPLPPRDGPSAWGVDLGGTSAFSAVAAFWPRTGRLEGFIACGTIPPLVERARADGVAGVYEQMARARELVQMGGRVVPVGLLLAEAVQRFGVPSAIAADRWRQGELADGVREAGLRLPEPAWRGQGWRDGSVDVRAFRGAVLEGKVAAPVSLAMRAALAEARTVSDASANEKLAKAGEGQRRRRGRDDLAAAIVLAVAEGTRRQARAPARRRLRSTLVG